MRAFLWLSWPCEETGMGVVEDKVIKNHFASEYIYNKYKDEKTCGILSQDDEAGTITIAEPVGLICGIIPTTNPTSTAIFKTLISLKTRNGIIISPHPRARQCTCVAARLVLRAAVAAGAPEDIIGWIDEPTIELSNQLMRHPAVKLILATGGPGMVHAAYSSGTPAIGVGAGNTPVVIDETADQTRAIASILMSKTFDNGVICASEQAVIAVDSIYDSVRDRFNRHGGYILDKEQTEAVRRIILINGAVNGKIVGQAAPKIAAMAGITVPATTKVLIGEVTDATVAEPFAHEKLSTILALYRAKDFKDAVEIASQAGCTGRHRAHLCAVHRPGPAEGARELLRRTHEDGAHPDQHAVFAWRHRRSVQLQPVAKPDAGLRKLGRKFSVGERGSEAPAEQEDRGQARGEHVVAQAAGRRSTSAAAAFPRR